MNHAADRLHQPPSGTVERWCFDFILQTDLATKLEPAPPPAAWEQAAPVRRLADPGRPVQLEAVARAVRPLGPGALQHPERRAQLFHVFIHHELQAAELMAWAILAFPDTPATFRRGLLGIALDEVRHLGLYRGHLESLGFEIGDFPVRDWFWDRVPRARNPAEFVALMGMGLEGSNLDHSRRFAQKFREFGDEEGAQIQDLVGREEETHVRFAAHWFEMFTGSMDFELWARHLPAPISPGMLFHEPVNVEARTRAGLPVEFVERLRRS